MNRFQKLIAEASQKYYSDGSSNLTDDQFDALLDSELSGDPDSYLADVGHGYNVELDTTYGEKYQHIYGSVGSLKKCRKWKELNTTLKSRVVCPSLKLDGISCVLYYVDGKVTRVLTRGDGSIGIDITDKVSKIFPMSVPDNSFTGAIRGEILMSYEMFDLYTKDHPEMKNPRNTTAGIINSKDGSGVEFLSLIVYTVIASENRVFEYYSGMHRMLEDWFGSDKVVYYKDPNKLDEKSFDSYMLDLKDEWYGKYPADGIVLTCEALIQEDNGYVEYDAQAYKFQSEVVVSEVIDVDWSMSKTRYAVPRVHISPIQIAGTTVEYCTGYNARYILDNNIGPGTIVTVEKRGEIIPNINDVIQPSFAHMIDQCPDCGTDLIWDGVHLKCPNPECSNAIIQDTLVWLDKLVPTDFLGDKLKIKFLSELVHDNVIRDMSVDSIMKSTYVYPERDDEVQRTTFAKMWNNLHSDSDILMDDAIQALNVPRFGSVTSKKLSDYPNVVNHIINNAVNYINEDDDTLDSDLYTTLCNDIGNANADSVKQYLAKFARLRYIQNRLSTSIEDDIKGHVAVTGKLSVKRSEFEKELKACGWILGNISKSTSFLITDDPNSSSSKNREADKFGITKVSELEFRSKYMR